MTENSSTMTQTPEAKAEPSTEPVERRAGTTPLTALGGQIRRTVQIGDIVLVRVDEGQRRPMIVTFAGQVNTGPEKREFRLSGTVFCEPTDYAGPIFGGKFDRAQDPARFHGRPSKTCPVAYGECLAEGSGMGQWITRPTNTGSGS